MVEIKQYLNRTSAKTIKNYAYSGIYKYFYSEGIEITGLKNIRIYRDLCTTNH